MTPDPQVVNALWGCQVAEYALDLAGHTLSLTVDCDTAGQHKRTRLLLGGIFGLHFDIDPSWLGRAFLEEPWTYIELTSIEMTRDELNGHSVWRLKAELWESKLEVLCTEWQVTSDGLS